MPSISVIVPVYKVEPYIHRCVDSILNQTFTDFELILVDDGSPDNCGAICDEYAAKDNRITVIHKENGGLSDARNAGIDWAFANSDSEWLTFIDSDDWVHPMYLEALYSAVKDTGYSISVCGYEETTGEAPEVNETYINPEIVNTESFYCEHNTNAVIAWGKIYKKDLFIDIRYPKGKIHEDEFTTYKLLYKYLTIAFIKQPLYYYYRNTNGIMRQKWSLSKLVYLDAYEQQTVFFKRHSFKTSYLYSAKKYIRALMYEITVRFANTENSFLRKTLKKKLRLALLRFRTAHDYRWDSWPFIVAFPFLEIIKENIERITKRRRLY